MIASLDISPVGAWRYWHRNAVVFKRVWLLGLMAWFAEPVVYLLAMGTGLGAYLQSIEGVRYMDFIAPGLLAVSAMFGANFEATWNTFFKMDRSRIYDAAVATPVSIADVALGEVLWCTTRAAVYGAAFGAVAAAFGVFHSWWGLLALPAVALTGFNFSVLGLIFTYSAKRVDYIAYYWTLFLTPMFMFAGVFFPLERLPGWLQTLAWFMPLHHAADLMRALTLTGEPGRAAGAALWLVTVSLALLWVPPVVLRRRMIR